VKLAFREVQLAFRRAPLLGMLGVTTIAFSLYAFGLFGLVSLNLQAALKEVEDRVEVRAFLVEGTTDTDAEELMREMARMKEVADVGYVAPDSALQRARTELEEFRDVMDGVFLPGSIEVRLKEGFRDPAAVAAISKTLESNDIVEEVRYGREWVEKLYRIRSIAGIAGSTLGAVFALVAVIIIGATIRMSILARTREIEVMRMVGATNHFVRLPYLIDGALKGVAGGMIAIILAFATTTLVSGMLMEMRFFTFGQALLGLLFGGLLGLLGSWLSVGRQLRRVWHD
jgi:cell division transport system permease protein